MISRRPRALPALPALLALTLLLGVAGCGGDEEPALPKTAYGPEGMAVQEGDLLAPASTAAQGRTVDGIECLPPAKTEVHVHSHLAVYVDGDLRPIPAGIGMVDPETKPTETGPLLQSPQCYYGLHVHAQDGVLHVEGPAGRRYTLGQFFDLWRQPLGIDRVAGEQGRLTVTVDGNPWLDDPRDIPLVQRRVIQISVGEPVAGQPVDWSHF